MGRQPYGRRSVQEKETPSAKESWQPAGAQPAHEVARLAGVVRSGYCAISGGGGCPIAAALRGRSSAPAKQAGQRQGHGRVIASIKVTYRGFQFSEVNQRKTSAQQFIEDVDNRGSARTIYQLEPWWPPASATRDDRRCQQSLGYTRQINIVPPQAKSFESLRWLRVTYQALYDSSANSRNISPDLLFRHHRCPV